jgi:hypothetical protein
VIRVVISGNSEERIKLRVDKGKTISQDLKMQGFSTKYLLTA